jgi:hypothetical protein
MRIAEFSNGIKKGIVLGMLAAVMVGSASYAADTPTEDPTALAATYEKQAVDLRATAAKHDTMAGMHHAGAGSSKVNHESIERHCKTIAKNLRAAADESDALAAELRNGAKK